MRLLLILLAASTSMMAFADQTLTMIKPEVVKENKEAQVLSLLTDQGLKIVALKMTKLSEERAAEFYGSLKDKPFYNDLVKYMTSGPIVAAVLEGPDAQLATRKIIGATDPAKAESGTVRKLFGKNIQQNAIHASDSEESAQKEIAFFFKNDEIFSQ